MSMNNQDDFMSEIFEKDPVYNTRRDAVITDLKHGYSGLKRSAPQKRGLLSWFASHAAVASFTAVLLLGTVGVSAGQLLLPDKFKPTNIFSTLLNQENYKFTNTDLPDFQFTYPRFALEVQKGLVGPADLQVGDTTLVESLYKIKISFKGGNSMWLVAKEVDNSAYASQDNFFEALDPDSFFPYNKEFTVSRYFNGQFYPEKITPFVKWKKYYPELFASTSNGYNAYGQNRGYYTQFTGDGNPRKIELVPLLYLQNSEGSTKDAFLDILTSISNVPKESFGYVKNVNANDVITNGQVVQVIMKPEIEKAASGLSVRVVDDQGDLIGAGFFSDYRTENGNLVADVTLNYQTSAKSGTLIASIDGSQFKQSLKERVIVPIRFEPDVTDASSSSLTSSTSSQAVLCTQEVKLCSDGSYVARTGPNCEFSACPASLNSSSPASSSISSIPVSSGNELTTDGIATNDYLVTISVENPAWRDSYITYNYDNGSTTGASRSNSFCYTRLCLFHAVPRTKVTVSVTGLSSNYQFSKWENLQGLGVCSTQGSTCTFTNGSKPTYNSMKALVK
jgi:hypothetical protein